MLDKRRKRMTPEEFYAWQEPMDEKYELVDGYPVKMMTGASRRHDQIVFTLSLGWEGSYGVACAADLPATLLSGLCRERVAVQMWASNAAAWTTTFEAGEVRLVVEVLSPSTREFNHYGKLEEYKSIPTMRHVLLIEPNAPQAVLWSRTGGDVWRHSVFEGLDACISIDDPSIALHLSDIYADLAFRSSPKLVEDEM